MVRKLLKSVKVPFKTARVQVRVVIDDELLIHAFLIWEVMHAVPVTIQLKITLKPSISCFRINVVLRYFANEILDYRIVSKMLTIRIMSLAYTDVF